MELLRRAASHPRLLVAVLLNALFVLLPFYDPNNIPVALSNASHFTSAVPAGTYNTWAAGMFIYAMYVPGYLAYLGSGYQVYAAYTAFKLIYFGLTIWLTYALYRVALPRLGRARTETLSALVLANPIWIMTSYVWVEYDIVPVAFLAVGYLLLRAPRGQAATVRPIVAGVALWGVSVFFYWFAAILFPTFLLYARSARERWILAVASVILFGTLLAVELLGVAGSAGLFGHNVVGANTALDRSAFFGLQFFVPLGLAPYLALVGVLALVVPLVFYRLRVPEPATAFVVLSLFIFSSPIPMPDNYVVGFAFAVLAFLEFPAARRRWRELCALWAFPLVGLALINLYVSNSEPDGVGVLFFGFDLFRSNATVLGSSASVRAFLWGFNLAVIGALALSFGVLARHLDRSVGPRSPEPAPPAARPILARPRRWGLPLGVAAAVLVVAFVFNSAAPNLVHYSGGSPSPIYTTLPSFLPSNGNVVRPIPGSTFSDSGGTIRIDPSAPPMAFSRWYQGEGLRFEGRLHFDGPVPRNTLVINGAPIALSVANASFPVVNRTAAPVPALELGGVPAGNLTLSGETVGPYRSYDGNATSRFPLGSAGSGYVLFFEDENRSGHTQELLNVQGSGGNLTLVRGFNSSWIELRSSGGASYHVEATAGLAAFGSWNYLVLRPMNASWAFTLNGYTLTLGLPAVLGAPPYTFGVGSLGGGLGTNRSAFTGNATGLFDLLSAPRFAGGLSFTLCDPLSCTTRPLPSADLGVRVEGNASTTSFEVNGSALTYPRPVAILSWGKFQNAPYAVSWNWERFDLYQTAPDHFYLIPVGIAAIVPYLLVAATWPELRRRCA